MALDKLTPWSCVLPDWPDDDMPGQWLRGFLEQEESSGVLGQYNGLVSRGPERLARTLSEVTGSLTRALLHDDMACAYRHASRLIGLGPGLTPAGDDYLLGLATIANMAGSPIAHLRPLLIRLVQDNVNRTTVISHAALLHAVRGRVRESIQELASAMARGDGPAMEVRGRQVVAIWATSGTDIAAGMLAGIELTQVGKG